ncbi:MAG TPA: hypothetical protein PLF67_08375 [Sphaerochaeta sp.]|nr:hypothetical protein [Sphaerochaeta sp.]
MSAKNRYSDIMLFDAVRKSLGSFLSSDEILLDWFKPKASVAHALANHLYSSLGIEESDSLWVDVGVNGADIMVHDRSGKQILGIIFSFTYLSSSQQGQLLLLEQGGCRMTLGLAFLPQKEYILTYRSKKGRLDYYHYVKPSGEMNKLKEKEVRTGIDTGQLTLGIKRGR